MAGRQVEERSAGRFPPINGMLLDELFDESRQSDLQHAEHHPQSSALLGLIGISHLPPVASDAAVLCAAILPT